MLFFAVEGAGLAVMFQAAVKTFSVPAAATSVYRGAFSVAFRRYCKKNSTKLRVSEALSGTQLGADVKVQVSLLGVLS